MKCRRLLYGKTYTKENHYLKTHQEEEPLVGLIKYSNETNKKVK